MAFARPRDRVQELSTSNSQTVFAVTGAIDSSYNSFASAMSVGDVTIGGVIELGVAYKSGLLTYSATNQVTVTTAFESKGTFSAGGTKFVFMGLPALEAQIQPNQVGGKLTLASGVPTMRSPIAGATAVLFTPTGLRGTVPVPINNGAFWYDHIFSETTQNLSDTTKSPAAAIANAIYDYWGWMDGSTWRATRSDWWKKAAAATMTLANPCVVTITGNDAEDGSPIIFTNVGGGLPANIPSGTPIYVKSTTPGVVANTFNVSLTPGGAAISTNGQSQSGTHTGTYLDRTGTVARGVGGNSEIDFTKLYPLNKNAITNGPGALSAVYLGSAMTNASGTIDHVFCTRAANFGAGWFGLWNAWNREECTVGLCSDNSSTTYGSTNTTINAAHNSPTARVTMIRGLDVGLVKMWGNLHCSPGASVRMICGFGLDTVASFSALGFPSMQTGTAEEALFPRWEGLPGMGKRFLSLNEKQSLSTASSWRTIDIMDGLYPLGFSGTLFL